MTGVVVRRAGDPDDPHPPQLESAGDPLADRAETEDDDGHAADLPGGSRVPPSFACLGQRVLDFPSEVEQQGDRVLRRDLVQAGGVRQNDPRVAELRDIELVVA